MTTRILIVGKADTISRQLEAIRQMGLVPGGPRLLAGLTATCKGGAHDVANRSAPISQSGGESPVPGPAATFSGAMMYLATETMDALAQSGSAPQKGSQALGGGRNPTDLGADWSSLSVAPVQIRQAVRSVAKYIIAFSGGRA